MLGVGLDREALGRSCASAHRGGNDQSQHRAILPFRWGSGFSGFGECTPSKGPLTIRFVFGSGKRLPG